MNNHIKILFISPRLFFAIIFNKLTLAHCFDWMSDKAYLKLSYRVHLGQKLNFDHPKKLTEIIQWMKLYDRRPLYVKLVDKAAVKQYVTDVIGEDKIIPTLGVYERFEDIDFDTLPESFVLKGTHDSGSVRIVQDKSKMDVEELRANFHRSLGKNMFYWGREFVYNEVKPRIIAEPYMEDEKYHELRDYKFFCFNGEPKLLFIASERFNKNTETRFDFFDIDFNHLDLLNGHPNADVHPDKPESFDEMVQYSRELANGIPFVRVDWYEINGKPYFGEMTFYHNCGFVGFEPEGWDEKMGSWITLPEKYNK